MGGMFEPERLRSGLVEELRVDGAGDVDERLCRLDVADHGEDVTFELELAGGSIFFEEFAELGCGFE